jgi:hypothetical protein
MRRWQRFSIVSVVLVASLGGAPSPSTAQAACTVPSGPYPTIQSAIDDPSCDPIDVKAGTFNENLNLHRGVDIRGAGAGRTIVDGTGGTVVHASGSTVRTLQLRDLTVTGGGSGGPDGGGFQIEEGQHTLVLTNVAVTGNVGAGDGGGIHLGDGSALVMTGGSVTNNQANGFGGGINSVGGGLTLTNVRVDGNTADTGGGIRQSGGFLEMTGGSVSDNEGATLGGGVTAVMGLSISIVGTTIRSNETAGDSGGGRFLTGGTVTIRDVFVTENTAGTAGGMHVLAGDGGLIEDSSISGNNAVGGDAGGLHYEGNPGEALSLSNSTIGANAAFEDAGGLLVGEGEFTATNVTIFDNMADADQAGIAGDGGGIMKSNGGFAVLRNSILSGNRDGSPGANYPECHGPVTSGGTNIFGSLGDCTLTPQGSDRLVDPMLGPVADNGGGGYTAALGKGSPAIGGADPSVAPPNDQRGAPRKDPDIGAYERVLCQRIVVNHVGTEGKDKLKGTNAVDGMLGLGGKDTLAGRGGKDGLCGGGGKDKLKGGGGRDRMKGQGGKDTCVGGGGTDKAVCEKERTI